MRHHESGQDLLNLDTIATVCAVLPHGEHGCVVRLLTVGDGLRAGYVRGGRGRRLRPVLQPGNRVQANLRGRVEEQLAALTVELVQSRALLALDPLAAAALEWFGGLLAAVLPEGQPHPAVASAFEALLDAMAQKASLAWAVDAARFELRLLAELGFGLDLSACAATGETAASAELSHVSPRSGRAVSRLAAAPYAHRLLALPALLRNNDLSADWTEVAEALRLTGFFIARDLLEGRARALLAGRDRLLALVDRRAAAAA